MDRKRKIILIVFICCASILIITAITSIFARISTKKWLKEYEKKVVELLNKPEGKDTLEMNGFLLEINENPKSVKEIFLYMANKKVDDELIGNFYSEFLKNDEKINNLKIYFHDLSKYTYKIDMEKIGEVFNEKPSGWVLYGMLTLPQEENAYKICKLYSTYLKKVLGKMIDSRRCIIIQNSSQVLIVYFFMENGVMHKGLYQLTLKIKTGNALNPNQIMKAILTPAIEAVQS